MADFSVLASAACTLWLIAKGLLFFHRAPLNNVNQVDCCNDQMMRKNN
jgi:hypothetical protein